MAARVLLSAVASRLSCQAVRSGSPCLQPVVNLATTAATENFMKKNPNLHRIRPPHSAWGKFERNTIDEPKMGLLLDDYRYATWEDDELAPDYWIFEEALRRLPHDVLAERIFRIKRALHYSGRKELLPESEWISQEMDDQYGGYLKAYIEDVEEEAAERKWWDDQR